MSLLGFLAGFKNKIKNKNDEMKNCYKIILTIMVFNGII